MNTRTMCESGLHTLARAALAFALAFPATPQAVAESPRFDSGSTGADGAFAPTVSQTVPLPESGVFNFTTMTIPEGVEIRFARNARNTPVVILASGDVTILGAIILDGTSASGRLGGVGGPGGFDGGAGGIPSPGAYAGMAGSGPGGGGGGPATTAGQSLTHGGGAGHQVVGGPGPATSIAGGAGGVPYGSDDLQNLIGGSGGGGGGASATASAGGGGGGGGAILIASSSTIEFGDSAYLAANGGGAPVFGGGGGAGGAIRLVATVIRAPGGPLLEAAGASNYNGSSWASDGVVRVEAFDYSDVRQRFSRPSNILFSRPNPVAIDGQPSVRIATIAGSLAPNAPRGSLAAPADLVLPASTSNPVIVGIEAANIPIGSTVDVVTIPSSGIPTTTASTPLAGSLQASTATAAVTLPAGRCLLIAKAFVDLTLPNARATFVDGERVARVEIDARPGSAPVVVYITRSGKRVSYS